MWLPGQTGGLTEGTTVTEGMIYISGSKLS